MLRRCLLVAGVIATVCLAYAPAAGAATDVRTCPLPVVGGDPDTVTLNGPVAPGLYTVTADESPGEASHLVTLTVVATPDGGLPLAAQVAVGFSPATAKLNLAPGQHYTVQWLATFDFGIHPCTSLLGQAPFSVNT